MRENLVSKLIVEPLFVCHTIQNKQVDFSKQTFFYLQRKSLNNIFFNVIDSARLN